jgi:hypothetical protein
MRMQTRLHITGAVLVYLAAGGTAVAATADDYALEPCINGGVSASGLFNSQAAENRYYEALAEEEEKSARIASD